MGSVARSTGYMVLQRPVEPAGILGWDRKTASAIAFVLAQDRPGHANQLVGQSDDDNILVRSRQQLREPLAQAGACLCRCCSTLRAPCTKSLRKYLLPRLLMPSNFCLPPVEYSPGTIPIQTDSFLPFPKALPWPTAAIRAVAVTGPTPGISVSRWQASFSLADFWMTRSISSMRGASCSSSILS